MREPYIPPTSLTADERAGFEQALVATGKGTMLCDVQAHARELEQAEATAPRGAGMNMAVRHIRSEGRTAAAAWLSGLTSTPESDAAAPAARKSRG